MGQEHVVGRGGKSNNASSLSGDVLAIDCCAIDPAVRQRPDEASAGPPAHNVSLTCSTSAPINILLGLVFLADFYLELRQPS